MALQVMIKDASRTCHSIHPNHFGALLETLLQTDTDAKLLLNEVEVVERQFKKLKHFLKLFHAITCENGSDPQKKRVQEFMKHRYEDGKLRQFLAPLTPPTFLHLTTRATIKDLTTLHLSAASALSSLFTRCPDSSEDFLVGGKYKGLLDKALETEAFEEDWYRWKYREKGLGESRALAKPVKSTPPAYTSVHSHMHKSHSHPSKRQKIVDDTADYLAVELRASSSQRLPVLETQIYNLTPESAMRNILLPCGERGGQFWQKVAQSIEGVVSFTRTEPMDVLTSDAIMLEFPPPNSTNVQKGQPPRARLSFWIDHGGAFSIREMLDMIAHPNVTPSPP